MLGWVSNNKISVNANITMEKYCICTWIDESAGIQQSKEKSILKSCARNNCNLLIDTANACHYKEIAVTEGIPCKINGVQF